MNGNGRKAQRQQRGRPADETYHRPRSVEELTERNIALVAELDRSAQAQRSALDRAADVIASFCGSMTFVWVHVVWFGVWVGLNTLLPKHWHFDPFPFTFLTFVVSLEAIFLSTFILIAQNHQERLADRRNHLDLQINLLSEQENTKMMAMLESIQKHLGIAESDPEVRVMEESTRPDKLLEQIERVAEESDGPEREQSRDEGPRGRE